jgi:cyclophilin family peptidyl-prolyl cis-trans isomerase
MLPRFLPFLTIQMISPLFRRILRLLLPALLLTTTLRAELPAAPISFTLTWSASGLISATWTDRSGNETGYHIAYRTTPGAQFSIYDTVGANSTSYADTPTSWPGCTSFEWVVLAYNAEGSTPSNIVTVLAPPRVTSTGYTSGMAGQSFSHTLTTACPSPVWTAAPLPEGLSFNAASGVISGVHAASGLHTVNVTLTSGGKTVTQTLKIRFFIPVPVLAVPQNTVPLSDLVLRRNTPAVSVALDLHFNDPDVTDASRLIFNSGTMDFLYYPAAAPATVENFKGYISRGDFLNTIIHRSIPGFVLQGGGYRAEAGTPGIPRQPPVVNEPEITNVRGTVAMAKSANNPDSATSEYFISLANNASNLNNQNEGFTVFARVPASGMAVADAIAAYCTFSFATTNPVLTDCPVNTWPVCPVPRPPAPAFSTTPLVKLISAGPVAPLSYTALSSDPAVCGAAVNGPLLELTPLEGGTATITVSATDLDSQSIQHSFAVTVEEHLGDWLTAQNFPDPADAGPLANPDGDTLPNICEFALMTDPQMHSPEILSGTTTSGADRFLALSFPVRKFTGSGFSYAVESQDALTGTWTEVWNSNQGFAHAQVVSSTDLADRTDVTVRDTAPITAGGNQFLRMRVTQTP